jgi:prevent-host-death family protein
MSSVGVRELRQNASAVLRRVEAGEIIEVTDRGRPVARLVPARTLSPMERMIAEGRVTRAEGSLQESLRRFPPAAPAAGVPLPSEILAQMRQDER